MGKIFITESDIVKMTTDCLRALLFEDAVLTNPDGTPVKRGRGRPRKKKEQQKEEPKQRKRQIRKFEIALEQYCNEKGIEPNFDVLYDKEFREWFKAYEMARGVGQTNAATQVCREAKTYAEERYKDFSEALSKLESLLGDNAEYDYALKNSKPTLITIKSVASEYAEKIKFKSPNAFYAFVDTCKKHGLDMQDKGPAMLLAKFIFNDCIGDSKSGIFPSELQDIFKQDSRHRFSDDDLNSFLQRSDDEKWFAKNDTKALCRKYLLFHGKDENESVFENDNIKFLIDFVNSNDIDTIAGRFVGDRIQGHSKANNGGMSIKDTILYTMESVIGAYDIGFAYTGSIRQKFLWLGDNRLAPLRAAIYKRKKVNEGIDDKEIEVIKTLGMNETIAFDPLYVLNEGAVINYAKTIQRKNSNLITTFYFAGYGSFCPSEVICRYISDRAVLMTSDLNKKYEGFLTFENLTNPNLKAVDVLSKMKFQFKNSGPLQKVYKNNTVKDMSFFDLVEFQETDYTAKTQRRIFEYIVGNTEGDWIQEYNRSEKEDKDLGLKSIDILENNDKICVEYQGEQHFRPISLGPAEYDEDKYSAIKNAVISMFNSVRGSSKPGASFKMSLKKSILNILSNYISQNPKLVEGDENLSYVANLIKEANGNFDILFPKIDYRTVDNIVSPTRWLHEINCETQKERDFVKYKAILGKNWKPIYVVPGGTSITENQLALFKKRYASTPIVKWNVAERGNLITAIERYQGKTPNTNNGQMFSDVAASALNEISTPSAAPNFKLQFIAKWISQYHDPISYIQNPYGSYNPAYHAERLQFYFNLPFDEDGESSPEISGMLAVDGGGEVWISTYNGCWYKMTDCPPITIDKVYGVLASLNNGMKNGTL